MLFVGEAEYTWPRFVRDYEAGRWRPEYRQEEQPSLHDSPMCLETAWRRPRAIRQAFTLALMHKHFYGYVRETSRQLDGLIRELRESQPVR